MLNFYYVYILTDTASETHHYVGFTQDLSERLAKHNAGEVPHTSKFRPWRYKQPLRLIPEKRLHHSRIILNRVPDGNLPSVISDFRIRVLKSVLVNSNNEIQIRKTGL